MAIFNNKLANINSRLPYAQQRLGVDLKLSPTGDLEVNNLNDISLIAGLENVAQALKTKIGVEPLGNRYHPAIGVNLPIGEKSVSAISLRTELIRTLRQDPRIDNIQVKVQVSGNVYLVDISCSIQGQDVSIPLQFVSEL